MKPIQNFPGAATGTGISKRLFTLVGRVSILQGLGLVFGFALQALISRTCGPEAVGVYTLFITWLAILSVVTVPGLESCLVYFLPRLEGKPLAQRLIVRTCLSIAAAGSVICGGIFLAGGNQLMGWIGLPPMARITFAVSLIFFSIGKLLDAVFLGRKDAPLNGYYNVVRLGLRIVLCAPLLIYPHAAWRILFAAIALECVMTACLRYFHIQRRYNGIIRFRMPELKSSEGSVSSGEVARTALPMFGISVVDSLSPFLDKAILGLMVPLALIGVYRISEYISSLNSLFVAPFVAFWPFISSLSGNKQINELEIAYKNITLAIITLMLPFSLALFELSGYAFSLFGPGYASKGTSVFIVLAVGAIVDAVAGPAGAVLRLTHHYRLSLLINTLLVVVYAAAAILLSRRFGIVGVAIARSATMIAGNAINVIANRMLLKVFPYTSRHFVLLGCGAGILLLRLALLPWTCKGTVHLAISFGEVALFACGAAVVLRGQIRQVPGFLKECVWAQG